MRVINRRDLAAEWGISPNVIDNMLQRGQLRCVERGWIDYDHALQVRAVQDPVRKLMAALKRK